MIIGGPGMIKMFPDFRKQVPRSELTRSEQGGWQRGCAEPLAGKAGRVFFGFWPALAKS